MAEQINVNYQPIYTELYQLFTVHLDHAKTVNSEIQTFVTTFEQQDENAGYAHLQHLSSLTDASRATAVAEHAVTNDELLSSLLLSVGDLTKRAKEEFLPIERQHQTAREALTTRLRTHSEEHKLEYVQQLKATKDGITRRYNELSTEIKTRYAMEQLRSARVAQQQPPPPQQAALATASNPLARLSGSIGAESVPTDAATATTGANASTSTQLEISAATTATATDAATSIALESPSVQVDAVTTAVQMEAASKDAAHGVAHLRVDNILVVPPPLANSSAVVQEEILPLLELASLTETVKEMQVEAAVGNDDEMEAFAADLQEVHSRLPAVLEEIVEQVQRKADDDNASES